ALMDPCKCTTFGVSLNRICFLVQACSFPCIAISPTVHEMHSRILFVTARLIPFETVYCI
ncbi:hypothetical protein L9F63_021787, partial [Diploptera punctata]